ncbi:hypothetical protein LINPERHAP1_LOCUS37172, partial [Linum perenne]
MKKEAKAKSQVLRHDWEVEMGKRDVRMKMEKIGFMGLWRLSEILEVLGIELNLVNWCQEEEEDDDFAGKLDFMSWTWIRVCNQCWVKEAIMCPVSSIPLSAYS